MTNDEELEKWAQAQPTLFAIRGFLEWCDGQKIELAKVADWSAYGQNLVFVSEDREAMLARYLEIDLVALENERRALLERASHD